MTDQVEMLQKQVNMETCSTQQNNSKTQPKALQGTKSQAVL